MIVSAARLHGHASSRRAAYMRGGGNDNRSVLAWRRVSAACLTSLARGRFSTLTQTSVGAAAMSEKRLPTGCIRWRLIDPSPTRPSPNPITLRRPYPGAELFCDFLNNHIFGEVSYATSEINMDRSLHRLR